MSESQRIIASSEADAYLAGLDHPLATQLAALRERILGIVPERTVENVKWNAPNYAIDGVDRVTLGADPRGRLRVVLHRGVKPVDAEGFAFDDPSGLVRWATSDRGVITVASSEEFDEQLDVIVELVARWLRT
jgi:hypothetical protein